MIVGCWEFPEYLVYLDGRIRPQRPLWLFARSQSRSERGHGPLAHFQIVRWINSDFFLAHTDCSACVALTVGTGGGGGGVGLSLKGVQYKDPLVSHVGLTGVEGFTRNDQASSTLSNPHRKEQVVNSQLPQ